MAFSSTNFTVTYRTSWRVVYVGSGDIATRRISWCVPWNRLLYQVGDLAVFFSRSKRTRKGLALPGGLVSGGWTYYESEEGESEGGQGVLLDGQVCRQYALVLQNAHNLVDDFVDAVDIGFHHELGVLWRFVRGGDSGEVGQFP